MQSKKTGPENEKSCLKGTSLKKTKKTGLKNNNWNPRKRSIANGN